MRAKTLLTTLLVASLLPVTSALAQSTLIAITTRRDHVYDPQTHTLYISTSTGDVQRYDVSTGQLLTPWHVGTDLFGIDVTPDGQTLLVCDRQFLHQAPDGIGIIHRVNANTGAATDVQWQRTNLIGNDYYERGSWDVSAVSNTRAYFTSYFAGTGFVPLRELNLTTNQVIQRNDVPPVGASPGGSITEQSQLQRSADRSVTFLQEYDRNDLPVFTIDTASNSFTHAIETGGGSQPPNFALYSNSTVNRDGSLIALEMYGASGGPDRIFDGSLVFQRDVTNLDGGICFDPTRDVLYAADSINNLLIAIDTHTWQGLYALPIGEDIDPSAIFDNGVMSMSSDGNYLFMSTPSGIRVFNVPEPTGAVLLMCLFFLPPTSRPARRDSRTPPI